MCYGKPRMTAPRVAIILLILVALPGCNMIRRIAGVPVQSDPSMLKSAETRWLLVKNPRFGDVPSEPEYIWVEEDKVPRTLKTLVRGKGAIIAPPEIVARYGSPPGGGRVSPRQGVPYQPAAGPAAGSSTTRAGAAMAGRASNAAAALPAAVEMPKRGYVVHVDTTRIAIDLTGSDGLRPGSIVSLRRDKTPVVHPVTGEVLGELDEEVGTARVVEMRDKFSVAEIQTVHAGLEIKLRDRVVPK